MKLKDWTHRELCELTGNYAAKRMGCTIVMVEQGSSMCGEIPDVLGFRHTGTVSVLFEIKVSRSDFLADKNKSFRKAPETGCGDWRFYVAPMGMIGVEDLPEHWGLLEVNNRGHFKKTHVPDELTALSNHSKLMEYYDKEYPNWRTDDDADGMAPWIRKRVASYEKFGFTEKNLLSEMTLLGAYTWKLEHAEQIAAEKAERERIEKLKEERRNRKRLNIDDILKP